MRPAIIAVGTAAATWSAPAAAAHAPALAAALRIARRIDGLPGVALTFDDGPHPAGTPAVLAALQRAGARATFFLVGEQVRRHPSLAREIVAAGHAVALHGDRHRCQLRLTLRALDDDLARVAATVADATGASPALYRPPYGVFSLPGLALVRRRGWRDLLWSRWGRDWRAHTTPAAIARRASRDLSAGDVILLHDADTYSAAGSWRRTAQVLPSVLEAVQRAGLQTVTL
jgi:peptidoglycan/xylan/chitin deacetylase (PgdA/CDA1 family)